MNNKEKLKHVNGNIKNSDLVYRKMREGILLGDYAPGSILSENALAAEFSVSRTPIRQALQQLEYDGLVTSTQGLGTVVTLLDLVSLKELYTFRMKLATMIGELSTPREISATDLKALEELLQLCRNLRSKNNPRELARINMEFHKIIMEYVTNRPLRRFYSQMYYQTNQLWLNVIPKLNWDQEVKENEEEYISLIDSLKKADVQAIGDIRQKYIERCFGRIIKYLSSSIRKDTNTDY